MTIRVRRFEWDEANVDHLELAHPHISLEDLEEIVITASGYVKVRRDRYGKMVYAASRGALVVQFNILPGNIVRIFSVHTR